MIDWSKTTYGDERTILAIAQRAARQCLDLRVMNVAMDLMACHTNGCPLKLDDLLAAPGDSFLHDVCGIAAHIDHDTGELHDCFLPRYSV